MMKKRNFVKIGAIVFLVTMVMLPTTALSENNGTVEISIRGGIGVHIRVVNGKDECVCGTYTFTTSSGEDTGTVSVPAGSSCSPFHFELGFLKPVTASITCDGQSRTRSGFIVGFLAILL